MEDFIDTHISYRTAVLAKQKHFYCICPHRFLDEKTILGGWVGHAKAQPSEEDIIKYIKDPDAFLIASTQQILREWTEQKKNLSVTVIPKIEGKKVFYVGFILNKSTLYMKKLDTQFLKYSDAMEDGLFNALL